MILLFMAGLDNPLKAQPQYYNYNTGGSGSNSFPFNITGGKDVQLLYLPGDFNQPTPAPAGVIVSVSFFISPSYALGPWTYSNFTIKMGQSNITSFTSGSFYPGSLTTVYTKASVTLSAAAGTWLTLLLDTPFTYDPTQSLVVDVGQCGVPGATGFSASFTTLSGNRRLWSVGGCPFVYSGVNSAIYHMGLTLAGPPIVVTTAATGVTSTSATLNGTANANGGTTTVNFDYGLTNAYGTTVAGVPATVNGSTALPVTANISGLLPGNTYHYRIWGTNTYGTSYGNDMTFTTPPTLPVVVTTAPSYLGSTSAIITGTVNAGGASTTVTFDYGLTNAYGTTVSGVPATINGNTVTPAEAYITGLANLTTYHYRINGTNSVGTVHGNDMTFTTVACGPPAPPGVISGPSSVCAGTVGYIYSVNPIPEATGYAWTVPPGAIITAGSNTNSVTVTMGATSGNVTVHGTNGCGSGPNSTLAITVSPVPTPTITGQTSMCVNSGSYSYLTEAGMTNYIWAITGGTIVSGQGTNQVEVTWDVPGAQWISVNYTNSVGCSAPTPTVFPVTVNPIPDDAGTITGASEVCPEATGIAYTVPPIANAVSYIWTLPQGVTITSGQMTNSITVDFATDAVGGDISVYGNNTCGNGDSSPPFTVTIVPLPGPADTITGPVTACQESEENYSVAEIADAEWYLWSLPTGATIIAGDSTNNVTVGFGPDAVSGVITVTGASVCGTGPASPQLSVVVYPPPTPPVITQNGDTLYSDAPAGNQWYLNGEKIPGAGGPTYAPMFSGYYTCKVTQNGCVSDPSNEIYVVITGLDPKNNENAVSIYPNPNDSRFVVRISTLKSEKVNLSVVNELGIKVYEKNNLPVDKVRLVTLDLSVPPGIYWIRITYDDQLIVSKVVIR